MLLTQFFFFPTEIAHLFFAKENDWGFSHFVSWNVSTCNMAVCFADRIVCVCNRPFADIKLFHQVLVCERV